MPSQVNSPSPYSTSMYRPNHHHATSAVRQFVDIAHTHSGTTVVSAKSDEARSSKRGIEVQVRDRQLFTGLGRIHGWPVQMSAAHLRLRTNGRWARLPLPLF